MNIVAIIPAAGTGSRYSKTKNKLLENLNGTPVIVHTLKSISSIEEISEIIICASSELEQEINNLVQVHKIAKPVNIISGGSTRQESVFNGLKFLKEKKTDFVLIHDAARPLIQKDIIKNAIKISVEKGSSIVAVPAKDTIKKVERGTKKVIETLNRNELWNIQTPQVFGYIELLQVHKKLQGQEFTDDSSMMEKLGYPVFVVMGSYKNIKITTEEDLQFASILVNK